MCVPSSGVFFGLFLRFSLGVSQKYDNIAKIRAGSVFFWRSQAAWESNFQKVALKALARARFHFGGEWVVFLRILLFSVLFEGRLSVFVVFVRVL